MAEPQPLDLLAEQIDVDQVAGALSALIPPQQDAALPVAEAGPDQIASAEVPVEPPPAEPAPVEPAPVETAQVEPDPEQPPNRTLIYDGKRFSVPADITQAEIQEVLSEYEKTPTFAAKRAQKDQSWARENIDSESGAPALISMAVGPRGDLSEADRLATLRSYYPGAVPYGEDNFLFLDPDTKKFTLYNSPGLDLVDVAEYGKAVFEVVGGTLGGSAGSLYGPGGTYGGLVAGTEFGARGFDLFTGLFGGRVRTPPGILGEFTESGTRALLTVGGEKGGRMLAEGGKRVLTGVSPTVRNAASGLIAKFESLGIEPVSAAVGRKGMLGRMGAGLEQFPTAGPIMQKQAEKVLLQLDDALQGISQRMGKIRTPEEAGAAIKEAVKAAEKRVGDKFSSKYDEVFEAIGEDSLVESTSALDSVIAPFIRDAVELTADVAPTGPMYTLINKFSRYAIMAESGNLSFKQLRAIRSELRKIKAKKTSGSAGDYDSAVNNIYNAITEDLSAAANKVRPDLGGKLKAIDREYFVFKKTAQKTFDKIKSYDADNAAYNYIMTSAKGMGGEGTKALRRLRENFTNEEWGDVAASVLYNIGRENASSQVGQVAEFSILTFMTTLSKIKRNGPEGMDALFGGTQFAEVADDLMNLVDVVGALKEVKRYIGVSNSGAILNQSIFWLALGEAGRNLMMGETLRAGSMVFGTILGPVGAAKLMTNAGFVRWLATPASEISKSVGAHMGRLVALSEAEPEIAEEIRQYYKAIRVYTGHTDKPETPPEVPTD